MAEALFYALAVATIFCAFNVVVVQKNPVAAIIYLVFVFFFLSGIYLLIGFPFLSALQILVYAGAIMVLFLFVVMLLDLKQEEEKPPLARQVLGILITFGITLGGVLVARTALTETKIVEQQHTLDSAKKIGEEFFSTYLIPFEATGILLLVTIAGVLVLSQKKEPHHE